MQSRVASCRLAGQAARSGATLATAGSRAPGQASVAGSLPLARCRAARRDALSRAAPAPAFGLTAQQRRALSSSTSPLQRYRDMITKGEINEDPAQMKVAQMLDELSRKVTHYQPSGATFSAPQAAPAQASGGGLFGGLFGGGGSSKPAAKPAASARMKPSGPKGVYVWGGTGSGKTFLMDIFYEAVPVKAKKRIHFHEWMIDVHERLHRLQKNKAGAKANTEWTATAALKQQQELKSKPTAKTESADDLVAQVANEMMNEAWLLCFDEFQVTHISDAIIMKRLFSILFERGAVVVSTSNRPPEDLYLNGLNRPLFLPFIPMLRDFLGVHDIASGTDYRFLAAGEDEDRRVYIHPNGLEEQRLIDRKFHRLAKGSAVSGGVVETKGRRIVVPKACAESNIAWFDFKDLCDKPLGAGDYLAVASAFHTVFIANIPKLTMQERDQVRRFITLIDTFYERHTKVVCCAEEDPIKLFYVTEEEKKTSIADEIFAWDRTVSRLLEMQSVKYLSEQVRALDGEQFLGQFDLQALTDDDLNEMWRRYDRDDSGDIDGDELRNMLEDVLESTRGHRGLSDEVFQICMEKIDTNNDGRVCFEEFQTYLSDFYQVSTQLTG